MDEDKGDIRMKVDFKDIAKDLLYYTGISRSLLWILRISGCSMWLIFTYHRVSGDSRNNGYLSIPDYLFEQHVRFIKHNFKVVSMLDGLETLQQGNSKDIYATINLDDGYMDNYLYAYPILKKYHVPATVFLATDFIGKRHIFWWDRVFRVVSSRRVNSIEFHMDSKKMRFSLDGMQKRFFVTNRINSFLKTKSEKEREIFIKDLEKSYPPVQDTVPAVMLGWDEIKKMMGGYISFGAHTKTHRDLRTLDDEEVLEELRGSKKEIEKRLGTEIAGFSYPFGVFDERVKALAEKAGFKYARTTVQGFNHSGTDRFLLINITVGGPNVKLSFLASRISARLLKIGWILLYRTGKKR
ncbi:MAG: polysaccharide deacetylase family protein [Candidatus Omnitrophica bacterium]|nr:polysaccharide deacetylase family protein [Candidatus Omnitrophota bacterium]